MRNKELYEPAYLTLMYMAIFNIDNKFLTKKRKQAELQREAFEFFADEHNNILLEQAYTSLDFVNLDWNKEPF